MCTATPNWCTVLRSSVVVDGRYKISVPLKNKIVEKLPNNYESALRPTLSIRCKTLRDFNLEPILVTTLGWVISHKELKAAKLCSEMMLIALKVLHHLKCTVCM